MRQATPLGSSCVLPGRLGTASGLGEGRLSRSEGRGPRSTQALSSDSRFKVPDGMGREGWSFTPSPSLWV